MIQGSEKIELTAQYDRGGMRQIKVGPMLRGWATDLTTGARREIDQSEGVAILRDEYGPSWKNKLN